MCFYYNFFFVINTFFTEKVIECIPIKIIYPFLLYTNANSISLQFVHRKWLKLFLILSRDYTIYIYEYYYTYRTKTTYTDWNGRKTVKKQKRVADLFFYDTLVYFIFILTIYILLIDHPSSWIVISIVNYDLISYG